MKKSFIAVYTFLAHCCMQLVHTHSRVQEQRREALYKRRHNRNMPQVSAGFEKLQALIYTSKEEIRIAPPTVDRSTLLPSSATTISGRTELSAHLRMLMQDLHWHRQQNTDLSRLVSEEDVLQYGTVHDAYLVKHHCRLVKLVRTNMTHTAAREEYFQMFENLGLSAWISKNTRRLNMCVAGYHFTL